MPDLDELIGAPPGVHGVVVAGPGAGKTRAIGRRVDSLKGQGVAEDDIVLLTLTNATARTLRERFPTVPVRTVHTYVLTALARLGALSGRRVADRWEQRELVRRDIQMVSANSGHPYRVDVIDKFLTAYGTGFRDEPWEAPDLTEDEAVLRAAWERVSDFLALHVFDDFAPELEQLLREGHHLDNPPRAVVVDEYQDLTAVELRIIEMVAAEGGAGVMACGDDMQSIYGFRDAALGGLTSFPTQYNVDGPIHLSVSHRCPKLVIDLAEEVAARAPGRAQLAPRPRMTSQDDRPGEARICTFPSFISETRWLARDIARRRNDDPGAKPAVIVAAGIDAYIDGLNDASQRYGLGLTFVDSRRRFAIEDDRGFRFAYAVLRLAADDRDQLAWRTVLKVVPRQPQDRVERIYAEGPSPLAIAMRSRASLDRSLAGLLDRVEECASAIRSATTRDEVKAAIDGAAVDLRMAPVPWDGLLAILEEPMLAEEEAVAEEAPAPAKELLVAGRRAVNRVAADAPIEEGEILVYTVFQAKGQEWAHVYLAGAYFRGFRDHDGRIGEGTRVLYVALTRASQSLTITKFRSAMRQPRLVAVAGSPTPKFPAVLVEAATAVGIAIEELGAQE